MKESKYFCENFYCRECRSRVAIKIHGDSEVRCMGCDARYIYDSKAVWRLRTAKDIERTTHSPFEIDDEYC